MADVRRASAKFAKAFEQASSEAEAAYKAAKEAEKAGKLEEALKAKQAPMTTPKGTGLPLMPRDQGMYTPDVPQVDLPRMPMVDKARAEGKSPKYTPRMQDLLDSPTARKKVNTLIEKGRDLGMTEWYGTEPLRQVAMDIGMSPQEFRSFLAQMASASQRNPVDQQNRMGSYLWHLSQTGQLPQDAFLLTNKIKRGKQERPAGTAIELPSGYGSLAQGDIFERGKQIAYGDIEGALPPDRKLGTFFRNYEGNLKPVTVDVNAVRGPVIERGDPRWLTSKLVEKDEEGNVIATHFPRKDVESGLMSLKQAKERPGFWEAAPSGSEYAGFEDLWQRAAKRYGIAPAEAQALGWYGSADVTALKTKPELYIDNLERMIRRTAEQTGQNPRQVMEDVLRGKTYLKKEGGAVDEADYQKRLDALIAKEMGMAEGGAAESDGGLKKLPWAAAGGGMAKAAKAVQKASKMADEVILSAAEREANKAKFLADSAVQQRMYTGTSKDKDFANFNVPRNGAWFTPSTDVASGYAKENDSKDFKFDWDTRGFKEVNTSDRVMPVYLRTTNPYQISAEDMKRMNVDNYKKAQSQFFDSLRAQGHDSAIFEDGTTVILGGPHQIKSAIGNRGTYDVTSPAMNKAGGGPAKKFESGGEVIVSPEELLDLPESEPSKAKMMMEILARMAKEQGKEEVESLKKKGAFTDLLNRGVVAPLAGLPVDLINMGLEGVDLVRDLANGKRVENRLASEKPFGGSEYIKDLMNQYKMTTGEDRPMMETGLSMFSPVGAMKGAAKAAEVAPKALRAGEAGLNAATAAARRPFTPATVTVEAVAPDLGKFKEPDWQQTITKRMISGEGAPVGMGTMGGRKTTKRPGQGIYLNEAGELEVNPMVAVDVPRAGNLEKNKALRADIATVGGELGQEAMAAHRFLPMATNQIKDATAMLIKPKKGTLSDAQIQKLGESLPGMIVTHNPSLGGVMVAPFEMPKGQIPQEFLTAQAAAQAVLGNNAKIVYGKSNPGRDLMYMPRSTYAEEGARPPSAASQKMRKRLQRAEKRLFPEREISRSGLQSMLDAQDANVR